MNNSLNITDNFCDRHIGIPQNDLQAMLQTIGVDSVDQLISQTIPDAILRDKPLSIGAAMSEFEYLQHIKKIADKNKAYKSFIGMGYYNAITPAVIRRNIFENPG